MGSKWAEHYVSPLHPYALFPGIYGNRCVGPRAQPENKDGYIAINNGKLCINYYISHCACIAFIAATAIENG